MRSWKETTPPLPQSNWLVVGGETLSVLGADRRMIRLSARVLGAEAFRPVRAKCHLHGCSTDIGRPAYPHAIFAECDDSAVAKKYVRKLMLSIKVRVVLEQNLKKGFWSPGCDNGAYPGSVKEF